MRSVKFTPEKIQHIKIEFSMNEVKIRRRQEHGRSY
jgi:hypothetical protein